LVIAKALEEPMQARANVRRAMRFFMVNPLEIKQDIGSL
jgi:hypothetical protein